MRCFDVQTESSLATCAPFSGCPLRMIYIVSSAIDPLQREQVDHHALLWKEPDSLFSVSRTNTPKRSIASIEEYFQRISRMLASILAFPRRDRRFKIILIGRVGSLPRSSQYTRTGQRQTEKQGADLLMATKAWLSGRSILEKGTA
jgi:hypothetical protein